jgi:hypothetical protein
MRPTVVLLLWWRSRIFIYRKASSSARCPTSTFPTVVHTCLSRAQKYMTTPFEGLSIRQVRATIPRTLCLLHTEVGFMSAPAPISVDIQHKKYTGEYEIDRGVLYVFFEGRSKSSAITGSGPELLARLLLIELVFHAPSWRDHPQAATTPRISPQE